MTVQNFFCSLLQFLLSLFFLDSFLISPLVSVGSSEKVKYCTVVWKAAHFETNRSDVRAQIRCIRIILDGSGTEPCLYWMCPQNKARGGFSNSKKSYVQKFNNFDYKKLHRKGPDIAIDLRDIKGKNRYCKRIRTRVFIESLTWIGVKMYLLELL